MHQVVGYNKLVYQIEIWLDCLINRCGYPKAQGRLNFNLALDFVISWTDFPPNKQTDWVDKNNGEKQENTMGRHSNTKLHSNRGGGLNCFGPFSPMIHCKWDVTLAVITGSRHSLQRNWIPHSYKLETWPSRCLIVINAGVYGGKPPMTYQRIRRALEGPIIHLTQQTWAPQSFRLTEHITKWNVFKYVWDFYISNKSLRQPECNKYSKRAVWHLIDFHWHKTYVHTQAPTQTQIF